MSKAINKFFHNFMVLWITIIMWKYIQLKANCGNVVVVEFVCV